MAERVEVFDVTIPPNTPASAPQSTPMPYSDGVPVGVEIVFPTGCSGLVGVRLDYSDVQLLPRAPGVWIRGSGEPVKWPLAGMPTGAGWRLTAYNTGAYPHTLQVRFLLNEIRRPGAAEVALAPVDLGSLNAEDAA